MHVANEYHVDFTQSRIFCTGDGTTRIIENSGSIGVFEDQGPVELAEFALLAAKRGNFFLQLQPTD